MTRAPRLTQQNILNLTLAVAYLADATKYMATGDTDRAGEKHRIACAAIEKLEWEDVPTESPPAGN